MLRPTPTLILFTSPLAGGEKHWTGQGEMTIYENKSCGLVEEMRSKIGEQQICNQLLQVKHSAELRPYKH